MLTQLNARSRRATWSCMILCAAIVAPLSGCINPLIPLVTVDAVATAFIVFMPLRSAVGTVARDVFVSIF
jgi:hypothetical protein